MTSILVPTLAPPRMATSGRWGLSSASLRYLSSFWMRKPQARGLRTRATPHVETWSRCAVPKASLT